MINTAEQTIRRCDMLKKGDSVVVALSGGADSVTLLHCLISLKEKYNLTIYAAHLNHMLRGEEAERDEFFCKFLCKNYNIELFVRRVDIKSLANEQKIGEELCGRQQRYAFFEELSEKLNAKIATAHTASDNAETLLFQLCRGASVTGAAGIPPVRGRFIRPLIDCTREEIERYCLENDLGYVTDSTNLSDKYTRNKLRHSVIPVLKELNPRFEEAASRYCESARRAGKYINSQANALLESAKTEFGYNADKLFNADEAVLYEALAILCESEARFSPEARHLDLLIHALKHSGAVDLGAYTAVCKQRLFRISPKSDIVENMVIPLTGEISFSHRDRIITASIDNSLKESNELVFRLKQGGETFTFSKRKLTKPLRKAFNELKIPDERRSEVLLLCAGDTVLWCEALGFSAQGEDLQRTRNLTVSVK